MGTRMEVAQLESRMNAEDYRKLQNLFLVSLWFQVSLLTALYYSTFISHLKNRVKLFISNFDSIEPYLLDLIRSAIQTRESSGIY